MTSSPALRRATGDVTACGIVYAGLTAGTYLNAVDSGMLGSDEVQRRLWVGQAITLTALAVVVITGAVRAHRARRAMAGIVTDLARDGGELRRYLAAQLGDPGLVIAYPVEGGSRYVDSRGQPISVPEDGAVATPVRRNGVEVALLIHHAVLNSARTESLASAVGLALEYERLNAEARAQLADLRDSGERIVAAGDTERRRLERDMHDGAQQQLVSLVLRGRLLGARHPDDTSIAPAVVSLGTAAEQLRMTARRLSSVLLDTAGLPAALAALAESRPVTMGSMPSARLPALLETTVYLLAERASRDAGVAVSVTEADGTVTAVLDCDSEPELGDLVDRVTTLGGTLHQTTADTGRTIVTARWEGARTA